MDQMKILASAEAVATTWSTGENFTSQMPLLWPLNTPCSFRSGADHNLAVLSIEPVFWSTCDCSVENWRWMSGFVSSKLETTGEFGNKTRGTRAPIVMITCCYQFIIGWHADTVDVLLVRLLRIFAVQLRDFTLVEVLWQRPDFQGAVLTARHNESGISPEERIQPLCNQNFHAVYFFHLSFSRCITSYAYNRKADCGTRRNLLLVLQTLRMPLTKRPECDHWRPQHNRTASCRLPSSTESDCCPDK